MSQSFWYFSVIMAILLRSRSLINCTDLLTQAELKKDNQRTKVNENECHFYSDNKVFKISNMDITNMNIVNMNITNINITICDVLEKVNVFLLGQVQIEKNEKEGVEWMA